jgi:hypothetical protein
MLKSARKPDQLVMIKPPCSLPPVKSKRNVKRQRPRAIASERISGSVVPMRIAECDTDARSLRLLNLIVRNLSRGRSAVKRRLRRSSGGLFLKLVIHSSKETNSLCVPSATAEPTSGIRGAHLAGNVEFYYLPPSGRSGIFLYAIESSVQFLYKTKARCMAWILTMLLPRTIRGKLNLQVRMV